MPLVYQILILWRNGWAEEQTSRWEARKGGKMFMHEYFEYG